MFILGLLIGTAAGFLLGGALPGKAVGLWEMVKARLPWRKS